MKIKNNILALLFALFVSSCYAHWNYDDFKIVAKFDADGSCFFSVDGKKVSTDKYRQSLELMSDFCIGCTTAGMDGYMVMCEDSSTFASSPVLYTVVTFEETNPPKAGTFKVFEEKGLSEKIGASVSVYKFNEFDRGGIKNSPFGAHLQAVSGMLIVKNFIIKEKNNRSINSNMTTIGYLEGELSAIAKRNMNGP